MALAQIAALQDVFDGIVDALFKLPSAAGHNTVVFSNVNTSLAVDTSISDLSSAISASPTTSPTATPPAATARTSSRSRRWR